MCIATIDLYYIILEDVKFDKYDPANIVFARLIFVRYKHHKSCKKRFDIDKDLTKNWYL